MTHYWAKEIYIPDEQENIIITELCYYILLQKRELKVIIHFLIQIIQNIDIIRLAGHTDKFPAADMRTDLNSIMSIMYLYFVCQKSAINVDSLHKTT